MLRLKCFCLYSTLLLFSLTAFAQTKTYTPAPGSVERKAIMDGLRIPVEKELKKKVVFKIDHLKVKDGWAFMRGVPQQPDGKKMDYKDTEHQKWIDDGLFDDWICALLHKEGGKWRKVIYIIGATDVPYIGWDKAFKAPPEIFE